MLLTGLIKWALPLPSNFTFGYWQELFFIYIAALLAANLFLKPEHDDSPAMLISAIFILTAQANFQRVLAGVKLPKMDTIKTKWQKFSKEEKTVYNRYCAVLKDMRELLRQRPISTICSA